MKIYQEVICHEKDAVEMEHVLDAEIKRLTAPYAGKFDSQEMEVMENLMYAIELKAEQEAFQLGMSYAFKLFFQMMNDRS
jgi:hypothetical protein